MNGIRLAAAACVLYACGGPATATGNIAPARPTAAKAVFAGNDAGAELEPDSEGVPTFAQLGERASAEIPVLHEVDRLAVTIVAGPVAPLRELEVGPGDTCFRAVIGATAASGVRVWFEDSEHGARGDSGGPGLVPPQGPACARRGETLRLVAATASPRALVRAVILQAP